MKQLSDHLLLKTYLTARQQKLDKDFIELLEQEMIARGLAYRLGDKLVSHQKYVE